MKAHNINFNERLSACAILAKVDKMPADLENYEHGLDKLDRILLAMQIYADQEVNYTLSTIYKRINESGRAPKCNILKILQTYAR
jgi:hypothetical protein